jgi:hypothetical protein
VDWAYGPEETGSQQRVISRYPEIIRRAQELGGRYDYLSNMCTTSHMNPYFVENWTGFQNVFDALNGTSHFNSSGEF